MSRRFPYASTALLALFLGASVWITARTLAANDAPSRDEIRAVAERIHDDRAETGERIERLRELRKSLVEAKVDEKRLAALDEVIAGEVADQQAREQGIREVAFTEQNEAALEDVSAILEEELFNLADAIGNLNQSYVITGVKGPHGSATGGSRFNDPDAMPETIKFEEGDSAKDRIAKLRERIEQLQRELEKIESDDAV